MPNESKSTTNMKDFSVAQVASWIDSLGVPSKAFSNNAIDGDLLFSLPDDAFLQHLGLAFGQTQLLQHELGHTKFSSYSGQTERTLEYLQQENTELHRENATLEKRNTMLQLELDRLRQQNMNHSPRSSFRTQYASFHDIQEQEVVAGGTKEQPRRGVATRATYISQ